jgi:hypothetical protein
LLVFSVLRFCFQFSFLSSVLSVSFFLHSCSNEGLTIYIHAVCFTSAIPESNLKATKLHCKHHTDVNHSPKQSNVSTANTLFKSHTLHFVFESWHDSQCPS